MLGFRARSITEAAETSMSYIVDGSRQGSVSAGGGRLEQRIGYVQGFRSRPFLGQSLNRLHNSPPNPLPYHHLAPAPVSSSSSQKTG